MLLPPARVITPDEIPASAPEVLPEIVRLKRLCVCSVWELTLNWNWLPVVLRIVMAPSSLRPIVPEVYVVFEFEMAEIPVCAV